MGLSAEQLQERRTMVTATDATAIAGVNPFRSALEVYVDKVSPQPEQSSPQAAQGLELEPYILGKLAVTRDLWLEDGATERHPIMIWVGATPDRFVVSPKDNSRIGVAEAKNVGFRMLHHWGEEEDAIPDYVHVQVQWQMIASRVKHAYVAALLGGRDFRIVEVEHDDQLATTLLEVCDKFWRDHVQKKMPPNADGSESARRAIAALFPDAHRAPVAAPPEAEDWASHWLAADEEIKRLEKRKATAEANLKLLCADHEGLLSDAWSLTWRPNKNGSPDWKAIAEAMGAPRELVEKHRRPPARPFHLKQITRKERAA